MVEPARQRRRGAVGELTLVVVVVGGGELLNLPRERLDLQN